MATATARPATKAVALAAPSADEITKILQGMGALETPSTQYNRIKVEGSIFTIDDEPFVYNPKTDAPAFTARIVNSPDQYQSLWIDDNSAKILDRPELAGRFCKSHFAIPTEARVFSETGYSCKECPAAPFVKNSPLENGKRCQWKGDVELQLVDPATGQFRTITDPSTGEIMPDERVWTLTLSTTAMMEWQGTAKDGAAGNVSQYNFMHKLALYGIENFPDLDTSSAIRAAINALGEGRVIAEFRSLRAENKEMGRTWTVPSATPTAILDTFEANPQLEAGHPLDNEDDLPPF